MSGSGALFVQNPTGTEDLLGYITADSCNQNGALEEIVNLNVYGLGTYQNPPAPLLPIPTVFTMGRMEVYPADLGPTHGWTCQPFRTTSVIGPLTGTATVVPAGFLVQSWGVPFATPTNPGPFISVTSRGAVAAPATLTIDFVITAQPGYVIDTVLLSGPLNGNQAPPPLYVASFGTVSATSPLNGLILSSDTDFTSQPVTTVYQLCASQVDPATNAQVYGCEPIVF